MDNGDKTYKIASITETGDKFYQVIGPKNTITEGDNEWSTPSKMEADWAIPVAFHPAGHQLIWEDGKNNFYVAAIIPNIGGHTSH